MDLSYRFVATPAAADPDGDATKAADPSDRAGQFVAVAGAESDQVNASALVVTAYGMFWLLAVVFIYFTYRNQCRLQTRVAELENRVREQLSETKDPKS